MFRGQVGLIVSGIVSSAHRLHAPFNTFKAAVLYFALSASGFVTGSNLIVDGGHTCS
jgi:hypothetical protein